MIEGAHEGVGLGIRFLKHVERTRLIAHLVDTSDASDRDPVNDFEIIERELAAFSPTLAEKPMIVVATKLDATTDRSAPRAAARVLPQNAALNFTPSRPPPAKGMVELVRAIANALDRIPKPAPVSEVSEVPYAGVHAADESHAPFSTEDRAAEGHEAAPHREER